MPLSLSLFGNWWEAQSWAEQLFWLVTIVSSLLLAILSVMNLFGLDENSETDAEKQQPFALNPRTILTFFTAFGWSALLLAYLEARLSIILALSVTAGIIAAVLGKVAVILFLRLSTTPSSFGSEQLMERTAEVLEPIPPHRNGFGKVYLTLRETPFESEAITAGRELPPGCRVRVVGVIDGRVLLVEPVEDEGYPHEQQRGSRRV